VVSGPLHVVHVVGRHPMAMHTLQQSGLDWNLIIGAVSFRQSLESSSLDVLDYIMTLGHPSFRISWSVAEEAAKRHNHIVLQWFLTQDRRLLSLLNTNHSEINRRAGRQQHTRCCRCVLHQQ
jgi:hypothetical protein